MKTVRKQILYSLLAVLCGGLTWVAQAGTVTDNFDSGADFFVTGIIGQTNWDGVYFGAGDIVGGTGSGTTSQANETTFPGYLTVQGTVGAWVGNEDDSFFIYKVVAGDFDASVAIVPPFASLNYHLPGILARAYNTNNSGAPYSATVTNSVENWMYIARFQEFSINEHGRYATNGADHDGFFNTAGTDSDTNSTRFVRMTRVGDLFSFYEKTNADDAWVLCSTLNRSDLNGVAMQVGIKDESGTANQPITYFTNFVLSGPNVTQPAMPAAPSSLVTTATNISGSLTFSWTKGTPADGSLLVIKPTVNIDHNPVNGITYNSDTSFGDANTLLDGANAFVVYNGTANSVTISNLAGYNTVYSVAVYEYSGSGASTVYNTASPATNYFAGPGQITGVIASTASTNIPVGGADAGFLFATFSSGGGTVDESGSGQTVWTSSDPTIANFNGRVLYGVAPGTVQVIGTFAGAFSATNTVTVHSPTFTDNFSQNQDYVANGLMGSTWDGLFLNFGDVPNANKGNDAVAGSTSHLDANITTNNALRVQAAGSTWAVAGNDGPYLFKVVTGDFEAVVHVGTSSTINNFDAGIMARLYDNSGGATQGGGGGTAGTETHINWVKVQNGTPAVRRTTDSGGTTIVTGLSATDGWLLMQRVSSTNFYMYESANPSNWVLVANLTVPEAANSAPMEVGIEQEMRTAADGAGSLDSAMIDGPGITPPATPPPPAANFAITLNNDLSMTFNWQAADASGNPIRSMLIMRAGAPVTALPTLAQAGSIGGTGSPVNFGTGLNLGGGNWMVFATGNPAASTNVTATVQGLTPGVTYYAAIVTFTGSGGSKSFNTVVPPGATGSQQDGLLQSVKVLPIPGIPLGGLQVGQVIGYFGGQPVNVSAFAAVTVANTNVVQFADGAFTGIALGSTTAQIVYGGVTNTIGLTVRAAGFTDEFGVNQDYLLNGVTNSPYDGVYRQGIDANEVPESQYSGVDLNGSGLGTASADANVTSNNVLTISATGDGWENDLSGGFFLFKYVPGDFQTAIHINSLDVNNYNQPGLMARAFSYGTNGTHIGSPFVLGFGVGRTNINNIAITNGESWVSFTRFDEFGLGTYPRLNLDSAVQQFAQTDQGDTNMWLLITRSGGTEFTFYKRLSTAGPWRLTPNKVSFHVPEFAGVPMQVGIAAGPFWWTTGANRTVMFEHYMLDAAPPALEASHSGGSVKLTWPAISAGAFLQQTLSLNPANWQTVPGTLTTNAGTISINVPMTNSAAFFRLSTP